MKIYNYFKKKVEDDGIEFKINFVNIGESDSNISDLYSPLICSDENRIMQVLRSIESNAIKFTHQGTISTTVEIVKNNHKEDFLKISVRDTGIGIP